MRLRYVLAATVVWMLVDTPARSEVPLLSMEELRESATDIVVGELRLVFIHSHKNGDFEKVDGIAEILPAKVEKGTALVSGRVVYARFWNQRWIGQGLVPPHSGGHHIPEKSKSVRAYLRRQSDGGFEILLPNGLVPLK